jgi:hypothetical protein
MIGIGGQLQCRAKRGARPLTGEAAIRAWRRSKQGGGLRVAAQAARRVAAQ